MTALSRGLWTFLGHDEPHLCRTAVRKQWRGHGRAICARALVKPQACIEACNPKGPCAHIVDTLALKYPCRRLLLRPKYVQCNYRDPNGIVVEVSRRCASVGESESGRVSE